MAYKQKGCSPITAKLKRTTKGGMVQDPLLNVGSVAKMKGDLNKDGKMSGYETARQTAIDKSMSSPVKITNEPFGSNYQKKMAQKATDRKKQESDRKNKKYDLAKTQYELNKKTALKAPDTSLKGRANSAQYREINKAKKEIAGFESKYKDRYKKEAIRNKNIKAQPAPNSSGGFPGVPKASNVKTNPLSSGYSFPKNKDPFKNDPFKTDTPKNDPPKTTKKTSYDAAYKNRDMKTYGKMDKATYIKEAKRQNASKKAGKGWDVKSKNKATPPRKKAVALDPMKTKSRTTIKPKVEEVSKAKANKLTRAAGVRAKGEAALASGNVRKARRLKRREERIKKRAARK